MIERFGGCYYVVMEALELFEKVNRAMSGQSDYLIGDIEFDENEFDDLNDW